MDVWKQFGYFISSVTIDMSNLKPWKQFGYFNTLCDNKYMSNLKPWKQFGYFNILCDNRYVQFKTLETVWLL